MPRVAAVRVADACERCAGSHAASLTQRDTTRFGSAVGERFSGDFRVAGSQSQSLPSLVAGMEGAADVAVAEVPLDDADADAEAGATGQHSPEPKLLDLDKAARRKDANRISAKELQAEHMQLTQKLSRLTDLLIDGSINKDIYEAKNKEILLRRQEIDHRLKQIEEPATAKESQES